MTRSKSGKARLKALVLSFATQLVIGISIAGGNHALAQGQKPELVIDAPSIFEFETATISPMPIGIKPEKAVPKRAMLLIRGVPGTVTLTEGRQFASGVWSVKISDLPNLQIVAPGSMETSNITFSLVTLDGVILAEKSAILSIATPAPKAFSVTRAPSAPAAPPPSVGLAPKPADPPPPNYGTGTDNVAAIQTNAPPAPLAAAPPPVKLARPLTFEESEKVQVFMQKGEENMGSGNINLARLFYRRAAEAGWAPGALALAETYDAEELGHMSVVGGIQPDAALAKKWYQVARDLGSATAEQKLQRLGQR